MNADEIVEKLQLVQSLLQELLPAAKALQSRPDAFRKLDHALAAVRKYSSADKARWRDLAACLDLRMHSKRRASLLIARREGLPDAAADTIRRAI